MSNTALPVPSPTGLPPPVAGIDLANLSADAIIAMHSRPFFDPPFIRHIEVWPTPQIHRTVF